MSKGLDISYRTDSLNNRLLIEVQKPNKGDEYFMYELAEGNPGALSVVSRLDFVDLEALKETDLRGSMIWVGYKDICGEDIAVFKNKIADRTIEKLVHKTPDYKWLMKNGRAK